MTAHKGGNAKAITISPVAEQWARDNNRGDLMDELRKFVAIYQASWKLRTKRRQTDLIISASQKRIDEALKSLKEAEEALYKEAVEKVNAIV